MKMTRRKKVTNLQIYVTQYLIFGGGAILFIAGMYLLNAGAFAAGLISLILGGIFITLSYIYARAGAKVILTNCPNCDGLGYIEVEIKGEIHKEVCPICGGTGKYISKSEIHKLSLNKDEKN